MPAVSSGSANSLTPAGAQIREFARSIKSSTNPAPTVHGSRTSGFNLNSLIPAVEAALDSHEKPMNEAVASAEVIKASASEYLASTAELVARLTISELHSTDRASKDIASAVAERNDAYLASFQDNLVSAQKKLHETKAQISALTKVAEQASAPGTESETNTVPDEEAADPPPASPSPKARGRRLRDKERANAHPTPRPEASSTVATENKESLINAGTAAVAAVQNEENILSTLEMLAKMTEKCSKTGP